MRARRGVRRRVLTLLTFLPDCQHTINVLADWSQPLANTALGRPDSGTPRGAQLCILQGLPRRQVAGARASQRGYPRV